MQQLENTEIQKIRLKSQNLQKRLLGVAVTVGCASVAFDSQKFCHNKKRF